MKYLPDDKCGCGQPMTLFSFNQWESIGPRKPKGFIV